MERGDKCGTRYESENIFLGDYQSRRCAGSACVLHVDKVIISLKRKKTMVMEHRCNTVGADPRRGVELLNL